MGKITAVIRKSSESSEFTVQVAECPRIIESNAGSSCHYRQVSVLDVVHRAASKDAIKHDITYSHSTLKVILIVDWE